MRCVLLPGGAYRGTSIRDFEAENVGDVNLSIDKRGDMLCLSSVLHTSYWAHLTKRQSLVQQGSKLRFTVEKPQPKMFQPRALSVSPITFFLSFLVIILTYRIFALEKDLRNMKS